MALKKPTIYDVAEVAGVVGQHRQPRAQWKIRRQRGYPITHRRIIAEMGYHPNMGARALRGSQAGCIGVIERPPGDMPMSQAFLIWLLTELNRVFGGARRTHLFRPQPARGRSKRRLRTEYLGEPLFGLRHRQPPRHGRPRDRADP